MRKTQVGVVAALYRFPVNRCAASCSTRRGSAGSVSRVTGSTPSSAPTTPRGFRGSPERRARPAALHAAFRRAGNTITSPIVVRTPDGAEVLLDSDVLRDDLAARRGGPVHLMQLERGTFDAAPLSLISLATVEDLGIQIGMPMDPVRFRQNILLDLGTRPPTWRRSGRDGSSRSAGTNGGHPPESPGEALHDDQPRPRYRHTNAAVLREVVKSATSAPACTACRWRRVRCASENRCYLENA